jgi:hypothetical protein
MKACIDCEERKPETREHFYSNGKGYLNRFICGHKASVEKINCFLFAFCYFVGYIIIMERTINNQPLIKIPRRGISFVGQCVPTLRGSYFYEANQ